MGLLLREQSLGIQRQEDNTRILRVRPLVDRAITSNFVVKQSVQDFVGSAAQMRLHEEDGTL